jgi:transcriptional regulator with XRE-family HTH domain
MSELLEHLNRDFKDEDTRYGYAESFLNAFVAAQIKELREGQSMSQQQLAEAIGTKQSGISRLENVNYSSWKVDTLRKLARALGVRLRISFEEFGTLVHEVENFRKDRLRRHKFADDPVFNPTTQAKPPQGESAPRIPAIPKESIHSQEPTDPLEEVRRRRDNLMVMKPANTVDDYGLGGIVTRGPQTQLTQNR